MMSGEDDELETGTLANGVVEEASSTVIEQRQTPIKRPQPEKPVEVPSQTSPVKGTKEGSAQGEEKVPSQACLGESSASPVCTPPRVAEDKPQKGLAEGDKAGKAAAPPDTPVAGSSKPKFVFGSAAKQLVTFNALARSESKADFSMVESSTDDGGDVSTGQRRRLGEARKKAKLEGEVDEKSSTSEQSEDDGGEDQDDTHKETDSGVFGTGKSYTSTILLTETKVATGEENETTKFSARAKLFEFEGGEWRERGLGNIKVNATEESARVIMRADGVLRLLLNTRIFSGMSFEIVQEKSVRLIAINAASGAETSNGGGKMGTFLLRFKSPDDAFDFSEAISAFT